jgi:hypothetical protein
VKWVGTTLEDALGNTVISATVVSNVTTYTYPGANSTTSKYTLNYTSKTIDTAFGCPLDQSGGGSRNLLTSITFPDQSTMSFTYEPVYNNSTYVTGRIASVKLRTGAWIYYAYTGGTNGVNCVDGSTAGFTKTTPDGVWTFTHSAPNGPGLLTQTTVKAPSGDVTTYLFSGLYPTQIYDAAHINVSTICYYGVPTGCTNRSTPPTLPITERDVFSVAGGMTSSSLKVFKYDNYSRLTDVKTYNSGGQIGHADFVTEEAFGYGGWNGSGCSNQTEPVQGVTVQITGLLCSRVVTAPGVSNPISGLVNNYYANTADLANSSVLIAGVYRNTSFSYDSLGRLVDTSGPNGEYSHHTYANACPGGTLPDSFSTKVSNAVTLFTHFDSVDCTGELPLHALDANNNGTTIDYTGDPFWRPKSITDAAGTVTTLSYTATSKDIRTLVTGQCRKRVRGNVRFNGAAASRTAAPRTVLDVV